MSESDWERIGNVRVVDLFDDCDAAYSRKPISKRRKSALLSQLRATRKAIVEAHGEDLRHRDMDYRKERRLRVTKRDGGLYSQRHVAEVFSRVVCHALKTGRITHHWRIPREERGVAVLDLREGEITLQELEDRLGCVASTISRWGQYGFPKEHRKVKCQPVLSRKKINRWLPKHRHLYTVRRFLENGGKV